jgi:hypothetical protein
MRDPAATPAPGEPCAGANSRPHGGVLTRRQAPPGKLVYPLCTLEPSFWPLVATHRPARMLRLAGLLCESRRGDSNPGPLHYE